MLLHRMALVSFRLFCKNLCNLQEFFGQMVYRPPSLKIARTPMVFGTVEMFLHVPSLTEKGPFTSLFVVGVSAKPFTSYNVMKTRAVTLSSKEKSEINHPCGKTTRVVLNRQRELLV